MKSIKHLILILTIIAFVPRSGQCQYVDEDIIIETNMTLDSIVSYYSEGCELFAIAQDENQDNHLLHISQDEEIVFSRPTTIEPSEFVYKDGVITYIENGKIIKYSAQDGTSESFDFTSLGLDIDANVFHLLIHDNILYISYYKRIDEWDIEDHGVISLNYNNLEILGNVTPDLPSTPLAGTS